MDDGSSSKGSCSGGISQPPLSYIQKFYFRLVYKSMNRYISSDVIFCMACGNYHDGTMHGVSNVRTHKSSANPPAVGILEETGSEGHRF